MKSNILTIEDTSTNFSIEYDCDKLLYEKQSTDTEINSWLLENIALFKNIDKLVIPIKMGTIEDAENIGLMIGLHIRTTKELNDKRLLPIIFISKLSKEEILQKQVDDGKSKSGLLLYTKSVTLVSSLELDKAILAEAFPISEKELLHDVLPNITIENTTDTGHQLANEWGAFRLAKFAGYSLKLEKPSSLYFKYKDSFTNNELTPVTNTNIGVFNESCKALLIDDNADSGWGEILSYILKSKIVMPGKPSSLDIIRTFEDSMKHTDYANYDVIFLDLRLLKEEDKVNQISNISDFTGTKVLRKIKDINKGIQVIIFTASNKVWNIEKLLEIGANGYYIKESPEYIHNEVFSKENYNELLVTVKKALSHKYLRRVDSIHKKCLNYISSDRPGRSNSYQRFYDRTIASFEIANQLLGKTNVDSKYFNFAFLTYFQIIEDYVSQRDNFDFISKRECYVSSVRTRIIDDSTGSLIWKLTYIQDRVNGDYFEILDEVKPNEVSIQTLAKVSFVLAFMFHKNNSFLKKWANLNNIRNTKAGHGGANGYVTSTNIEELLEIIELILT